MTISRRQFTRSCLAALAAAPTRYCLALSVEPLPRIRVLIVDGINNHDWKTATHGITEILTRTGLFSVEVSTTPPREAPVAAWDTWRPTFARYNVVINNFNGGDSPTGIQWPAEVEASFETYVRNGGGLVSYHAGNNAFEPWQAYNEMIGLGWRPPSFGPGITIADDSQASVVIIPQGTGHGPGHPANLDFQIHVRNTHHPITLGMPPLWMHPFEQLTHGQHGPAQGLTILTFAHSPVTNQNEPMDWVRDYGRGRAYTTMLGHTWAGDPCPNLDCVGFQTLLARGVEWAATGGVTIPIPTNFPGPDNISLNKLT
jgi:type 1 glutamine amidotransferase